MVHDIRFKHPFGAVIVGPSGKSLFFKEKQKTEIILL